MCYWNEMYWETYLSDQTNKQTVISIKAYVQSKFLDKMG